MAEATTAELTTKSVMGTAGANPAEQGLLTRVSELSEQKRREEALTHPVERKPVTPETFVGLNDQIGVKEYDAYGNRIRNPQEQVRLSRLESIENSHRLYLENEYNSLPAPQKLNMRLMVEQALRENSLDDFWLEYSRKSNTEKQQYLTDLFNRQSFKDMVRTKLLSLVETPPAMTDVDTAGTTLDTAAETYQEKQDNKTRLEAERTRLEQRTNDFRKVGNNPTTWGTAAVQMNTLETKLSTPAAVSAKQEHEVAQANLTQKQKDLDAFMAGPRASDLTAKKAYSAELENARNEANLKKAAYAPYEKDEADLAGLKTEKEGLPDKQKAVETSIKENDKAYKTARKDYFDKRNALVSALAQRPRDEEALIKRMGQLVKEVQTQFMSDEWSERSTVVKKELESFIKELKGENEKVVATAMERRHSHLNANDQVEWHKEHIRADYKKLLNEGPDALINDYMDRAQRPNPTPPPPERPLTPQEKNDLRKNKEFMTMMQDKVVEGLLLKHKLSKGKFTGAQLAMIESRDWGKGKIAKVRELADNIRINEDAMRASGDYKFRSFGERFNYHRKRIPWGGGLLLLALVAAMGTGFASSFDER